MKKKGIRVPGIGHRYYRLYLSIAFILREEQYILSALCSQLIEMFIINVGRIKSRDNRDKRVELLQKYGRTHFPAVKYMEYAVTVETYTLTKANNLVMNVDGAIGSLFLDLLGSCAMFTQQEIDEIVEIGYLNGLFVLARSIGLIGYAVLFSPLDTKPLYLSLILSVQCSFS
jgi:citrate synthase